MQDQQLAQCSNAGLAPGYSTVEGCTWPPACNCFCAFLMDRAVAPALYPLSLSHIFTPPQKKRKKICCAKVIPLLSPVLLHFITLSQQFSPTFPLKTSPHSSRLPSPFNNPPHSLYNPVFIPLSLIIHIDLLQILAPTIPSNQFLLSRLFQVFCSPKNHPHPLTLLPSHTIFSAQSFFRPTSASSTYVKSSPPTPSPLSIPASSSPSPLALI